MYVVDEPGHSFTRNHPPLYNPDTSKKPKKKGEGKKVRKWTPEENLYFNTFALYNYPYLFEKRLRLYLVVE
jgi:hypothetical protein